MKSKRFYAMKDGHWWSVMDTENMKRVPCPLEYLGFYHRKKDAKIVAKAMNQKVVRDEQ